MKPVLIVAGLGRCGSSLCMQMLQAGGVDCVGEYPAFEPSESDPAVLTTGWLASNAGRAVKCLDPQRADYCRFSEVPRVVLWLDRDPKEQAKSMVKFGRLIGGIPYTRAHLPALRESLRRDRVLAFSWLKLSGCESLRLEFEHIIEAPIEAAARIAAFIAPHFRLDVSAAAKQVLHRPSKCLRCLLEAQLIERIKKNVDEDLANG